MFYFPLFLYMVIYDNEYKTNKRKSEPRAKLSHNINTVAGGQHNIDTRRVENKHSEKFVLV